MAKIIAATEEEEKALRVELDLLGKDFASTKADWSVKSQGSHNCVAIVSPDRFFEVDKENKIMPSPFDTRSRFKENDQNQHHLKEVAQLTKKLEFELVSPHQSETYVVLAGRIKERLIISLSS